MIKINYLFVITTAQLLSENDVPKFTGAEVRPLITVRLFLKNLVQSVAHHFIGDMHDWLDEKRQVWY